jgi:hypothetical protein
VPRLDLLAGGNGWESGGLWLNGRAIESDKKAADHTDSRAAFPNLVLKRGWNHIVLRVTHGLGDFDFKASLRSSKPKFLSQLQAAVESPK